MAKQKGTIRIKGTIGGLTYYTRNGVDLVRQAGGGFNGEAIKTKPSMERVRENNSEFGRVAKVKSLFRRNLMGYLSTVSDLSYHARMVSVLQKIKVLDTVSARGKRDVVLGLQTPIGRKMWSELLITNKLVNDLLPGIYEVDAETLALQVSSLDFSQVLFPKGATFLELCYSVLVMDFEEMVCKASHATPLFLEKGATETQVVLPLSSAVEASGMLFPVVAVRFYQEVGGEKYMFKEGVWQGVEFL